MVRWVWFGVRGLVRRSEFDHGLRLRDHEPIEPVNQTSNPRTPNPRTYFFEIMTVFKNASRSGEL